MHEELEAKMSTMKSRFWTSFLIDYPGSCEYGSCLLLIPSKSAGIKTLNFMTLDMLLLLGWW